MTDPTASTAAAVDPGAPDASPPMSIDITPRTWHEVTPLLLVLMTDGDAKGRRFARRELQRMARVADLANLAGRTNLSRATPVEPTWGALAQRSGKQLALQVLRSAAGFYLGTLDEGEPYTRESAEYWPTQADADDALASGRWTQRLEF